MINITQIVFDVDGVFTNGQFLYNDQGKQYKIFGAHDSDGVKILRSNGILVSAITADKRGFKITQKRMHDMAIDLRLVFEQDRLSYMQDLQQHSDVCFMGDGHFDAAVFPHVSYSIAPSNAVPLAKKYASYVTEARGGEGAVYEAANHVILQLGTE